MKTVFQNTVRSILTASVIVAGFAATADAAELRKNQQRVEKQAVGGLTLGRTNGTGAADLMIVPASGGSNGQPNTGYCGAWNGGDQSVRFYVRNVGSANASASHVQINFGGPYHGMRQVPALAPNQQVLITEAIPLGAWGHSQYHGSVNFLIAADHLDAMNEPNEGNNFGQSQCVGPAT